MSKINLLSIMLFMNCIIIFAEPAFKVLPFSDIKPKGWIYEQMLRDITSGNSSYLENVRKLGAPITISELTEKRGGYGEFEGNFTDAIIRNAILTGYQPWLDRAKNIADFLVANQDEKGYIGRKRPENFKDLAQNEMELWSQCCFMRAFLAYYEFSKDKKYLDSALKSVNFIMSVFGGSENKYFVGESSLEGGARAHGLMYIDVLEKLYQLTKNKKYLDFAFRIYEDYSTTTNIKNTDHQMASLLDKDLPFMLHAPHVAEHSRVIYWLSSETESADYKNAATNSMNKMRSSLSPSGALVTDEKMLECVAGNNGSADLRYEYCSITEGAISFESAFQKFGNVEMAEMAENTVFNAAQAARFSDGKANAYCSKDNQMEAVGIPDNSTFRHQYAACHRIACCVYNVNRVMPYYVSNMWLKSEDEKTLVAAFYGPSVVNTIINGTKVYIEQKTLYPFENEIEMIIQPEKETKFDILLRIPTWSSNTKIEIEGANIIAENGYVRLKKTWKKGDVINISFHPKVEIKTTFNNQFYAKRGALMYALGLENTNTPTKFWEGSSFANYDLQLKNKEDEKKYLEYKLPSTQNVKAYSDSTLFVYSRNLNASKQYPYDNAYGFITTKFIFQGKEIEGKLVPIGSTLLRKATFID